MQIVTWWNRIQVRPCATLICGSDDVATEHFNGCRYGSTVVTDEILSGADQCDVAFLVVGDPLG